MHPCETQRVDERAKLFAHAGTPVRRKEFYLLDLPIFNPVMCALSMKITTYALLVSFCSFLLASCAPRPGAVPIADFFQPQKAAEQRDREGAVVRPAWGEGAAMVPGQETPITIPYEAFDEQAYIEQRFAGKRV